jgi:hypothetical protein
MPILTKADKDIVDVVTRMVAKYHQPLRDAGVTFAVQVARPKTDEDGEPTEIALKANGYPCAAKVRVIPYRDRVNGLPDAEITIDGDEWDTLTDRQRDALVDHEVEHLELVTQVDARGVEIVKRDDCERPRLKLRLHDHQHGWFDSVVRRHGESSPEWRSWEAFEDRRQQLWLPYMGEEDEVLDEVEAA